MAVLGALNFKALFSALIVLQLQSFKKLKIHRLILMYYPRCCVCILYIYIKYKTTTSIYLAISAMLSEKGRSRDAVANY